LRAKWYADADANGIPNFVERALGRDPGIAEVQRQLDEIARRARSE